jgi:hypothetical protein
MEIYDENNQDDLFLESVKMLQEIQKYITEHKDDRVKEVGDRVIIWDGSYNIDKNTLKHRSGIDKLFQNHGIVIETNCNYIYTEKDLEMVVSLDLLIKFETGEEVYTKSEMVKRIDDGKI